MLVSAQTESIAKNRSFNCVRYVSISASITRTDG